MGNPKQRITADFLWLTGTVCKRAGDPRSQQDIRLAGLKLSADRALEPGPGVETRRGDFLRQLGFDPPPAFAMPVIEALARDLPSYPPRLAFSALNEFAHLLRNVNFRAVLDAIIRKDAADPEWLDARRTALHLLVQVDPADGRRALIAELLALRSTLDERLTKLLPASAVPPMDAALLDHLARTQRGTAAPGTASPLLLIARYLSPESRERMRRVYESQTNPCQPEMLAYFLRADQAYARQILGSAPWDMKAAPGKCLMQHLSSVPRLVMTPVLEEFLIAHLNHGVVGVKDYAAGALATFGTLAAKKPLWDAYLYFHDYWKGREAELLNPDYREGRVLKQRLRNAIARNRSFVIRQDELRAPPPRIALHDGRMPGRQRLRPRLLAAASPDRNHGLGLELPRPHRAILRARKRG